jgi:hypothetical protein
MPTKTAVQRVLSPRDQNIQWDDASPLSLQIETRSGLIKTRYGVFVGGKSDGVEVIEVDTGATTTLILPTRGMSIWRMRSAGTDFAWQSPVPGPVHPNLVPTFDPSGLGFLEGFDELVVRCGLESNGAPQFDENGQLVYPLHGRIAGIPADGLSIEFDEASGRLEVIGEMIESRLFLKRLRLRSRIRFHAGKDDVELLDDVTNDSAVPASMQLLYHINIGLPVLSEGATVDAAIESLAPKDSLSAGEIETWNQIGAPEDGYSERVYFARLRADENNVTTTMIRSADQTNGLAISHHVTGLPRFVLWKNTAAVSDGYVVGLEPATNFPNIREFEAGQGRVVEIAGGESKSFRVTLHPLTTEERVSEFGTKIQALRGDNDAEIHSTPRPGWTPGA